MEKRFNDLELYKYMINNHLGKENQISYAALWKVIVYSFNGRYLFANKDVLRSHLNELFKRENPDLNNFTLISTSRGVFVAKNRNEIEECAIRLRNHALGELKRYGQLMRLPQDFQVLVDFKNDKLRFIDRWQQQRLFDLDEELYEISIDREKNNV